jgi:hypothetical protein
MFFNWSLTVYQRPLLEGQFVRQRQELVLHALFQLGHEPQVLRL